VQSGAEDGKGDSTGEIDSGAAWRDVQKEKQNNLGGIDS